MGMDIDEAINTVKENICSICAYGSRMDECDISSCDNRDAIAVLTTLKDQYEKGLNWIPVSERVPDKSGMYLVTGQWKNEPCEIWICEFLYLGKVNGWANSAKRPIIKAWMPLPKPYEPQESEEQE